MLFIHLRMDGLSAMTNSDIAHLAFLEFRYDKRECILSILLHTLTFLCVLFLLSIASGLVPTADEFLKPVYSSNVGYFFTLKGYEESDEEKLSKMGFTNLVYLEDGSVYACKNDLVGLQSQIFFARLSGRDIWSSELEDILKVLFAIECSLASLCILLALMSASGLSGAVSMKLLRRERYIAMLGMLGASKRQVRNVFALYFFLRLLVATVLALLINAGAVAFLNSYISTVFAVDSKVSLFSASVISVLIAGGLIIVAASGVGRTLERRYLSASEKMAGVTAETGREII